MTPACAKIAVVFNWRWLGEQNLRLCVKGKGEIRTQPKKLHRFGLEMAKIDLGSSCNSYTNEKIAQATAGTCTQPQFLHGGPCRACRSPPVVSAPNYSG